MKYESILEKLVEQSLDREKQIQNALDKLRKSASNEDKLLVMIRNCTEEQQKTIYNFICSLIKNKKSRP